jgi:membrane-associated phospholipid phosphatase
MGVHYLSDVIVGGILGVIVGLFGLQIYPPMVVWFTSISGISLW